MATCETCGVMFEATGNPTFDRHCFNCFHQRVNALCAEIDQAAQVGPGMVTAVYPTGMLDLGADPQSVRADIVAADLTQEGK
jgi:hypothetical protein